MDQCGLPQHLQGIRFMNLDTTFWAIIAVLKMLDYTAFANCSEARKQKKLFLKN